ncbi:RecX family transcriptional regulator [Tumebacillus sp. ITR2]|uniref:Regulatory protein RecX n=1 Tax=Tumebacillus amylolyticus TaxID=2801339 RepID=A0ABS1JDU6_9BACL|nr:RecX family transcriptional regulator [Tumebacillus amylolyticus]MBL0388472.1 RecX family transcriptional regulator [Tumebacillus amylolyticus]
MNRFNNQRNARGKNRSPKGSWGTSRSSDDFVEEERHDEDDESEHSSDSSSERRIPNFRDGQLTSLTTQKGNPDRLSLFLDEKFLMGIRREVAYQHGLKKGLDVTADFLREVWRDEEGFRARDLAVKYLGMKPRTRKQMRDYLLGKEYDETVAERTIEWLAGYGYLDDGEYARQWVENRTRFRPRGKAMLRWELQQKGVTRDDIDEAISTEFEGDVEIEAAVQLLQKKVGRKTIEFSYQERQKLAQHLARRGFSGSVTAEAIRRFRQHANLDND